MLLKKHYRDYVNIMLCKFAIVAKKIDIHA